MTETLGPYRIVAPIARGGMAETFVGERTGLAGFAQRVCVKRIFAQGSADPKRIRHRGDAPASEHRRAPRLRARR